MITRHTAAISVESLENRTFLSGDVVLTWNQIGINAIRSDRYTVGPTWASRNMAMLHAAMFDAINGIDNTYRPYAVLLKGPRGASVIAAAAAAADTMLSALYPVQQAKFHAALRADLATIPDGPSETLGVHYGRYVANRILSIRSNDNSTVQYPYYDGDEPGEWRPTPPDQSPPLTPSWGYVKPFALRFGSQYRPPSPPALTSAEYTAAFNEVKEIGAADSTTRTAEQTQIAIFWSYDTQTTGTPIALYNKITRTIAQSQGNTLIENARLFALTNIAMADAGIAAWDAKYIYNFWRPITGIREAETDMNPNTTEDPDWNPLGIPGGTQPYETPSFPSYVSGHATFGGAFFTTLIHLYGNAVSFTVTSDELPYAPRTFSSFTQAMQENANSRIYLGVHWRFDNTWATQMGQSIANYIDGRFLTPQTTVTVATLTTATQTIDSSTALSLVSGQSTMATGTSSVFSILPIGGTIPDPLA